VPVNFFYLGLLSASDPRPEFRWLSERSSSGIQHLAITFGDEEHHAVLHPYNPLSFEVKSDVDPCIFKGNLKQEPDTEVLVTGGCAASNTFEVIFSSTCFEILQLKENFKPRVTKFLLTQWLNLLMILLKHYMIILCLHAFVNQLKAGGRRQGYSP
jgi:hypothetical protein